MPDRAAAIPRLVSQLAERIAGIEGGRAWGDDQIASTGCRGLDRLLPGSGLRAGSLLEWLSVVPGSGATALAAACAGSLCRGRGICVAIDRRRTLYPPALWALGIPPTKLVVVRPTSDADEAWAIDQTLRCRQVGVVLAWPRRIGPVKFRRWQLAAEAHGTLGMLLRPATAGVNPSSTHIESTISTSLGRSADISNSAVVHGINWFRRCR